MSINPEQKSITDSKSKIASPWNVVVHDDPVTLMTYVTHVFMEVFGYPLSKAQSMMLKVHREGRCIVWTGGREQSEIYVTKLSAYHLLTTMERVCS